MGRRTFDVVAGFPGPWPFGDRPCFVATHRPLPAVSAPVQAVSGDIGAMVAAAKAAAGGLDVYIDGGALIRQALSADLVDALTLTTVPVVLGLWKAICSSAVICGCTSARAAEVELVDES
ncbi:MAG: dihydrofolate reductase family protein [Nannocystis sp.]|nr:dihydrofolate reductase family protein [Nannocystis sp.]